MLLTVSFSTLTRAPPVEALLVKAAELGLGFPNTFGRFKKDLLDPPLVETDFISKNIRVVSITIYIGLLS